MNDIDKVGYQDILSTLKYEDYKPSAGEGKLRSFEYNRDELEHEVIRFLNTFIESENEYDDLQGEGMKIIILSKSIVIWTRLETLLELGLSGNIDTLTEASNLKDEICRRCELQNEKQFR